MCGVAGYPTDHREPWIDDNGFLRVQTGAAHRTRAAVEHDLQIASAFTVNGLHKTIWDARAAADIDREIWVPLINRLTSIVAALAVLVSDVTQSETVVFAERINTLLAPCQVFAEEESAVAWLQSIET